MMKTNTAYRVAMGVAVAPALFLLWMHGAVASEGDSPGMLFYTVLAVGAVGALAARFRARGMAWAMFATAVAQVIAAVIAMAAWGQYLEIGLFNAVFVVLWTASGMMFRRAAAYGM